MEEQKVSPEEETKKVIKESLSIRFKQKIQERATKYDEKYKLKYPKAHEKSKDYLCKFKDVWAQTFPNSENVVKNKMDKRKERAKIAKEWEEKQKEMTQEELDAYMEDIPEWKRGALVVGNPEEEEEKKEAPGIFGRVKNKVKSKIDNTEAAQKFYESEDYEKLTKLR